MRPQGVLRRGHVSFPGKEKEGTVAIYVPADLGPGSDTAGVCCLPGRLGNVLPVMSVGERGRKRLLVTWSLALAGRLPEARRQSGVKKPKPQHPLCGHKTPKTGDWYADDCRSEETMCGTRYCKYLPGPFYVPSTVPGAGQPRRFLGLQEQGANQQHRLQQQKPGEHPHGSPQENRRTRAANVHHFTADRMNSSSVYPQG